MDRWEGAGERAGAITISVPGIQPAVMTIIQSGREPSLTFSPSILILPKNGGTAVFSVTCDVAWNVSKTADWLDITGTQGTETGNGTVSVTAAANAAAGSRTAELAFSSFGTVRSATVVQRGQKRTWDEWKEDEIASRDPDTDQTGPTDSPAGDGIPNLLKYATGLDPLKPCGNVVQISTEKTNGGAFLVLAWPVNQEATGIRHLVESSEDLQTWTEMAEVETEGKAPPSSGIPCPSTRKVPAALPAPENLPGRRKPALTRRNPAVPGNRSVKKGRRLYPSGSSSSCAGGGMGFRTAAVFPEGENARQPACYSCYP